MMISQLVRHGKVRTFKLCMILMLKALFEISAIFQAGQLITGPLTETMKRRFTEP